MARVPLPAVMGRMWMWYLPQVVWVVFVVWVWTAGWIPNMSLWFGVVVPIAFFVPQYAITVFIAMKMRTIKAAVVASEGRTCTHCVQDLRGIGDVGVCPECGAAFDIESDRLQWARAKMWAR